MAPKARASSLKIHAKAVMGLLAKEYPKAAIALTNWKTPWELLVAVILSAQCTDVRVNIVTRALFAKYKTLDAYVNAAPAEFERDIASTGFYHAKAKHILAAAKIVKEKFRGEVPRAMEEIITLPGVARKTANVVLGNAYGVVVGVAVDTHVLRLSQRLRLVDMAAIGGGKKTFTFQKNGTTITDFKKDADPVKIEQELMSVLPKEEWFATTYRLIDHGRAVCKARNPNCSECVLRHVCPASRA
jgi:endonuclease-3